MNKIKAFLREWRWALVGLAVVFVALVVLALGQNLGGEGSIGNVGLFSALLGLLLIPAAVAVLFVSLRLRDRIGHIPFQGMMRNIRDHPMAASLYLSAWVLAIAWIVAAAL